MKQKNNCSSQVSLNKGFSSQAFIDINDILQGDSNYIKLKTFHRFSFIKQHLTCKHFYYCLKPILAVRVQPTHPIRSTVIVLFKSIIIYLNLDDSPHSPVKSYLPIFPLTKETHTGLFSKS